jgi:aldehyde:ferredoxin oxidoreductase
MIPGYFMKIAEINLTTEEINFIILEEKEVKKFIGGSGIGAKLLYGYTDHKTDPLSSENVLIFMTGPLTGTKTFSSDRFEVITKSPLTGIYTESDCGGRWGEGLKKCGLDGIVIKGEAKKPVYITIKDEEIKIKSASHLWGKDTFATDSLIKEEISPNLQVVCIGKAGENLVKFACIINEGKHGRAAGRAGVGAVMGSKKLKAIGVLGTKEVKIAHEQEFNQFIKGLTSYMVDQTEALRKYGTSNGVEYCELVGDLPIKNWYQGNWEGAKKISGQYMAQTVLKENYHCGRCVIGCGRTVEITEGKYKIEETAGPEYETIGMLGSNCLVDDIEIICKANELCNRYGLDTISTGSAISFCMEAYERGLITKEDTGGLKMEWGNGDALLEMIEKIANRQDIGKLLGEGLIKAAKEIGGNSCEFAIHVKGLDFPAHDPRGKVSVALGYATSNRGACHLQAFTHDFEDGHALPDLGYKKTLDRFEIKGKAKFVVDFQHLMSMFDSLHCCKFIVFGGMTVEPLVKVLNLVTGWDFSKEDFLKTGERIFNLKRLYNVREGISRKDDTLPPRILTHPRGGGAGDNLPYLNKMLNEYYQIRGWDEFGIPTKETLKRLELEEYIK